MEEIITMCWNLVNNLVVSAWDLTYLVAAWAGNVLYHIHVTMPRLEGLLVGILLAWLMSRSHKHPILRVLSSPLKLVVDILDLTWDQITQVISDLWTSACRPANSTLTWVKNKAARGYKWLLDLLKNTKNKLLRKKEE